NRDVFHRPLRRQSLTPSHLADTGCCAKSLLCEVDGDIAPPNPILEALKMESISESNTTLKSLSHDLAQVVERVGPAVVAVNARRHLSSSGVCWRDGVVVTAAHTVRRTDSISVISTQGATLAATLAGADPSTDLAVLRVPGAEVSPPLFGDTDQLEIGHLVIAVGRGARRGLNATLGIVGVLSGAWRTWAGGLIDRFVGLNISL